MKKQLTAVLLCFCAASMMAQEDKGDSRLANIDWKEDSIEITTVKDIVRTKQSVASRAVKADHFAKVWGKRGFFNIAYNLKSEMTPHSDIETGLGINGFNEGKVPKFSAKWGASIQVGKSIKLHKKPIANTACFNLDYTGVDINFNYYKAENGGKDIYDSKQQYTVIDPVDGSSKDFYYLHWNLEKYCTSYGMSLGPSITLAPFNYVKGANGLHFLKFNFYYHIGYRASIMLMMGKIESDIQFVELNTPTSTSYVAAGTAAYKTAKEAIDKRNENQFVVGHGLYQSWGINMIWKRIGIGYEHSWSGIKYMNIAAKSEYGDRKYKFDTTTNRVYLTYRFGK